MYVAIAGFLRGSEVSQILLSNVNIFQCPHEGEVINALSIYMPTRKNVAKEQGDLVFIGYKPGYSIDLFPLLFRYLRLLKAKPPKYTYLFSHFQNGNKFAKDMVSKIFKKCALRLGLDPRFYASHSARIGGVTSAMKLGLPDAYIKDHGSWASTCFLGYYNDTTFAKLAVTTSLFKQQNDTNEQPVGPHR
jgi:hypothetical protein